jgi:thiamine biosynthesis lipoprotein
VNRLVARCGPWALAVIALGLVLAFAAVRRPPPVLAETRFLMDTLATLTLFDVPEERAAGVFAAAFAALEAVDREMARMPETPLRQLNEAGRGKVSSSVAEVLTAALAWARRTQGSFDPTVAPLLDLWDIPSGPHPPPDASAVAKTRARVDWRRVVWDGAAREVDLGGTDLDFGGIAKGYAIDRAAEALRAAGVANFLLNVGGDLYLAGSKGKAPWRVGLQHPRDPDAFLRVVAPVEGALVTSGDYERTYLWEGQRIHHILDPRTGYPARHCQSVTVWAATALDADALATAVFVLGPKDGLALLKTRPPAEGLVVDAEGRSFETAGFERVAPGGSPR